VLRLCQPLVMSSLRTGLSLILLTGELCGEGKPQARETGVETQFYGVFRENEAFFYTC
jgi:hypothetical protein